MACPTGHIRDQAGKCVPIGTRTTDVFEKDISSYSRKGKKEFLKAEAELPPSEKTISVADVEATFSPSEKRLFYKSRENKNPNSGLFKKSSGYNPQKHHHREKFKQFFKFGQNIKDAIRTRGGHADDATSGCDGPNCSKPKG